MILIKHIKQRSEWKVVTINKSSWFSLSCLSWHPDYVYNSKSFYRRRYKTCELRLNKTLVKCGYVSQGKDFMEEEKPKQNVANSQTANSLNDSSW